MASARRSAEDTTSGLVPFVKLADPAGYRPCTLELVGDAAARDYWVDFFCEHLDTILDLGCAIDDDPARARERADACRAEFVAHFRAFQRDPGRFADDGTGRGGVSILTLDTWRDQFLRRHGFVDCFREQKRRENEAMLPLIPGVVAELDRHAGRDQLEHAVRGVFAGNIFDMGAKGTAARFLDRSPVFAEVVEGLPARPWRIDEFDAFADRQLARPYRRVVFFIDNAGSDFLLGAVPLIRLLCRQGAGLVVAANERPTLNDMTIHDVRHWWPRVAAAAGLAGMPIELVSTGTGEPLIDLRSVSPGLNAAAADADLVILEGMGRGVESNLDARLTCDRLNLAMVKDGLIARTIGGELYDCVCRFEGR